MHGCTAEKGMHGFAKASPSAGTIEHVDPTELRALRTHDSMAYECNIRECNHYSHIVAWLQRPTML